MAAATGITGVARDEWPFADDAGAGTGAHWLTSYTGRTYPSPLATHGTELFWTNDDGVYVLPQRDVAPERYVQLEEQEERSALYRSAVELQRGRLDVPRASPNLFGLNHWICNIEGSTLFMPISDVTRQCLSAMLLYFDDPHRYYIHDPRLGGDPLRPLADDGWFDPSHGVDLWDFERWQMVDMNGVEQGLVVQSLLIATQALGLGGHPFSGGKGRVTMGGEPFWHAAGGTGWRRLAGLHLPPHSRRCAGGPRRVHPGRPARHLRGLRAAVPAVDGGGRRRGRRPAMGRGRRVRRLAASPVEEKDSPASPDRPRRPSRPRSSSPPTSGTPTGASRRPSTRS